MDLFIKYKNGKIHHGPFFQNKCFLILIKNSKSERFYERLTLNERPEMVPKYPKYSETCVWGIW